MQATVSQDHFTRDWTCAYCGNTDRDGLAPKDLHVSTPGYAWRLVAQCVDGNACADRRTQ